MATERKRKPRNPALQNETKAAKFVRLATARVSRAIKALGGVGNLGGAGYERTDAQVAQIEKALEAAHNDAIERLKATSAKGKGGGFSFS